MPCTVMRDSRASAHLRGIAGDGTRVAPDPGVAHVTNVELAWAVLPRRPSNSALVAALGREQALSNAVPMIEHEARRLTDATVAVCVFFGWVHRVAWTVHGHVLGHEVIELVAEVAGRGHRARSSHTVVEPIGRAPARAVLIVRRDDGFRPSDDATLATLAASVAPVIERLVG